MYDDMCVALELSGGARPHGKTAQVAAAVVASRANLTVMRLSPSMAPGIVIHPQVLVVLFSLSLSRARSLSVSVCVFFCPCLFVSLIVHLFCLTPSAAAFAFSLQTAALYHILHLFAFFIPPYSLIAHHGHAHPRTHTHRDASHTYT